MTRLFLHLALATVLTSCSGPPSETEAAKNGAGTEDGAAVLSDPASPSGSFAISGTPGDLYTAVVYIGGPGAQSVEKVLTSGALPRGASQQVVLRSVGGDTFVELTKWSTAAARNSYKPRYVAVASAYWRRDFSPVDQVAKPQASHVITGASNVQWSEFLLRDPSKQQELYEQASGMARNMVEAGPDQLQTLTAMKSTNGASVALLALWSNRDGFSVFEEDATFGEDPYWAPVADNAHWMMRPILLR